MAVALEVGKVSFNPTRPSGGFVVVTGNMLGGLVDNLSALR